MINDVLHHVPSAHRGQLLREAFAALRPRGKLIIKDIEPGSLRSHLGLLADRYISGDRQVSLIGRQDLEKLVRQNIPVQSYKETSLYEIDCPNYAVVFGL